MSESSIENSDEFIMIIIYKRIVSLFVCLYSQSVSQSVRITGSQSLP